MPYDLRQHNAEGESNDDATRKRQPRQRPLTHQSLRQRHAEGESNDCAMREAVAARGQAGGRRRCRWGLLLAM